MELRHLRYYIAVAEEQNITRAAGRLNVSQPPLSRQIRGLEEELGVNLLERVGKRLRLTEAGRSFLVKARRIVCDAETSVQQLQEEFGNTKRKLRLGFISPFADDLIAPVVREFQKAHPKSSVTLFDLPPRAQLDRLRAGEIDVAILGNIGDEDRARFRVRCLWRGQMVIVLPDRHPLARRKSIRLAALAGEIWVSLSEVFFPGRRMFLQRACQGSGFEPKIVAELDSLHLMLAAIAVGDGVGIMPAHAAKISHSGCKLVKIAGPALVTEVLLVHRNDALDDKIAALLQLLSKQAARL